MSARPRIVTIVDYGVGNIGSLINMLDFVGVDCRVANAAIGLDQAECLILPGVGAFDTAMRELKARDLIAALSCAALERRIPVLGVCLGMQLLGSGSDEGQLSGLGWIDARATRLAPSTDLALKVPHIGWADVNIAKPTVVFPLAEPGQRFYFVHSYAMRCADPDIVAATVDYGGEVCCALAQANILGVQFHPEKSHQFGMRLLKDFAHHG